MEYRQDAMAKLDVLKKMIDPRPLSGQPQPSQQQLQSQPPMGQISQGGQLQPQMSQIPLSPMEYQQQMQMNSGEK